ncbi:MAG: polysaccharide biosynthesis tyrosine autokinase [Hyphomicrobium sp.]|jgi:capsular exopolysaccharide synthesis family protein
MQDSEPIARLSHEAKAGPRPSALVTPHDIKRFLKRYAKLIFMSIVVGLVVAAAYVWSAVPMYTARTQLILDPSLPQILRETNTEANTAIDAAQIESQLEILRSDKIALAVIENLKLQDVAEFAHPPAGLWPFGKKAEPTADTMQRNALSRFQSNLSVRRVGLSYAIEILYRAQSPELAAKVANATAEAYIQEQFSARAQTARRSNDWLEHRIDELRAQMNEAALNAQEFRAKRDYRITSTRDPGKSGESGAGETSQKAAAVHRQNTIEELDTTAQTYRRIYESYLKAYTESVQKQSYPVTNARVITEASDWIGKSHPKTKLVLAFGGLVGGLVGFGIAFFRHSIDRSVSSAQQIRDEIGIECLASIPLLATDSSKPMSRLRRSPLGRGVKWILDRQPRAVGGISRVAQFFNAHLGLVLQGHIAKRALRQDGEEFVSIAPGNEHLNTAVAFPFSGFSHGVKTWKTAIALASRARPIRSIAVTSALPNEGKSTLCSNLAALYAASGTRVLLIDGDLRTGRLSNALAPDAEYGLVDALEGVVELEECIVATSDPNFSILPVANGEAAHSEELLGSSKAQALLKQALNSYELVIIELPPLVASVDSLAMSALLDTTIIIAEWGKTPVPVISEAVHMLRNARAKILGIVLNKVDTSTVRYGDVAANYLGYWSPSSTPQLRRRA